MSVRSTGLAGPGNTAGWICLRFVILQDLECIEDDTEMACRLKVNIYYRNFCGFIQNTPSHDRLSDFKRETPARVWRKIFYTLDAMLEEKGYFDGSDHSIDGTAIELDKKAVPGSWGATHPGDTESIGII